MSIYAEEARSRSNGPTELVTTQVVAGRGTIILFGVATSGFFAVASLLVATLLARALLEGKTGIIVVTFVGSFTMLGACIGAWTTQPTVTRLARRRVS